jgi:2,4-dienoyl-CoA reductase-like NADH-dependent reductase (Old Yellow Enzyme family)
MSVALFDPIEVNGLLMRNRLWAAPMCQYSVLLEDGVPVDWHLVNLGGFARGGSGLVITEATAVSPEGRITPQDTGIWNDTQRDAWAPIVTFIRSQGAVAGIQLAHAGRKASTYRPWASERGTVPEDKGGWQAVGPSAIAFEGYAVPRALETAELKGIADDFAAAAVRAVDAGFQVIEIHAAHGYLLHEFLSPLSNTRTDQYGGSLENRARLLLDVVDAIRASLPEVVIFVRFSASDWAPDGWDVESTAIVAGWASEHGADFFDISSGGLVAHQEIPVLAGYQVPFAETVKSSVEVSTSAVGLITEAQHARDIVATGQADAVMLGRELLRDPHFPLRAADELGVELDYWPPQYLRAKHFS